MAIKIDKKICISCNACTMVCPGNLLYLNEEKKAEICDPKECWDCSACLKECPVQAIEMYLFPEVGGSGSTLNVKQNSESLIWQVKENGKIIEEIVISKKDSNKF